MSDEPKRIQRKRSKGWRMPEGAIYVGRPTLWGNPWHVSATLTVEEAVAAYRVAISNWSLAEIIRKELRGKDLACWCGLDQPCHADVLLELANAETADV